MYSVKKSVSLKSVKSFGVALVLSVLPATAMAAAQDLCAAMAQTGSNNSANDCLRVTAVGHFSHSALPVCNAMVKVGSYSAANTCLTKIKDQLYQPEAAQLCLTIASTGSHNSSMDCLAAINGKGYNSGSLAICQTMVSQGSYTSAMSCLTNNGGPLVVQAPINQDAILLQQCRQAVAARDQTIDQLLSRQPSVSGAVNPPQRPFIIQQGIPGYSSSTVTLGR